MKTALWIFGGIGILVLIYHRIQNERYEKKLQKLNQSRPKLTRAEYIAKLKGEGFDENHVGVVYNKIYEFNDNISNSIYPEDDLHKVWRINDLDDIELVDKICAELNLKKPEQSDFDELNADNGIFDARYILKLTKNLQRNTA
ncbi:hypothetical protein [Mangrovimonas sp. ST2L15]|uniref:hypothetical protein n=1 Tax=Mangrovimonas sp. ST2L15 TaxID=1645916 RepID=UPI0006B60C50|nr:hypothetical protein [Mangrovimonas sp. ST2L15]